MQVTIMNRVKRSAINGAFLNLYQVALLGKEGTSRIQMSGFQKTLVKQVVHDPFR